MGIALDLARTSETHTIAKAPAKKLAYLDLARSPSKPTSDTIRFYEEARKEAPELRLQEHTSSLELARALANGHISEEDQRDQTTDKILATLAKPTEAATQDSAGRTASNLGLSLVRGLVSPSMENTVAKKLIKLTDSKTSPLPENWQANVTERLAQAIYCNQALGLSVKTKLEMATAIYERKTGPWESTDQQRNTLKAPAHATWQSEPAHGEEYNNALAKYASQVLSNETRPTTIGDGAILASWGNALCSGGVPHELHLKIASLLEKSLEHIPSPPQNADHGEAAFWLSHVAASPNFPEIHVPYAKLKALSENPNIIYSEELEKDFPAQIRFNTARVCLQENYNLILKEPSSLVPAQIEVLGELFKHLKEHPSIVKDFLSLAPREKIEQLSLGAQSLQETYSKNAQDLLKKAMNTETLSGANQKDQPPSAALLSTLENRYQTACTRAASYGSIADGLKTFSEAAQDHLRNMPLGTPNVIPGS